MLRPGIKQLAKEHSELALMTYVEICRDKTAPAASRVAAATMILAYGEGRPIQQVQVLEEHTLTLTMPTAEEIAAERERRQLKKVFRLAVPREPVTDVIDG